MMENKEKRMFQEARMKLKLTRNKVADLSDGFSMRVVWRRLKLVSLKFILKKL